MNVKELRTKYNLTQGALAKELGVTNKTISLVEGGKLKLSDKLASKIKEIYGETVEQGETAKAVEEKAKAAVAAEVEKVTEAAAEAIAEAESAEADAAVESVDTAEKVVELVAEPVVEQPTVAPVKKAEKPSRKAAMKKTAAVKKNKKAPEKKPSTAKKTSKPAEKKAANQKTVAAKIAAPTVIIQSPFGGEISADEILAKVPDADKAYIRVDQNKIYWVKGEETGDVDIW